MKADLPYGLILDDLEAQGADGRQLLVDPVLLSEDARGVPVWTVHLTLGRPGGYSIARRAYVLGKASKGGITRTDAEGMVRELIKVARSRRWTVEVEDNDEATLALYSRFVALQGTPRHIHWVSPIQRAPK